ncbi:hypothetical protein AX15_001737 [Amanita polypyramis BW_CC]|nr:hypothetical protein AX15_001737 [Amanita polypyramis BW_CC]
MVFASKLSLAAALAAFAGTVAGQASNTFQIYQPGSNWWWVAQSQNVMTWDCKSSPVSQFTVFITNSNPSVLSGRLAFIAQQANADCSKLIEKTQINQAPATGYKLQFADVINSSIIYAESGEFEIKALGATYPLSSSAGSSPTSSSNSSSPSSTSSSHNGANSVKTSVGFGLAAIGVVLGFMTA